eukprot:gene13609-biopygen7393
MHSYESHGGDGKREVDSGSQRLTLGSGKHKTGSRKQSAASRKRKGTNGFLYHELKHRECQQWKRKVGDGRSKVTGEEWTGGTVSPLNGGLSSCRCSRENDPLPCYDVPPASCKTSAGARTEFSEPHPADVKASSQPRQSAFTPHASSAQPRL